MSKYYFVAPANDATGGVETLHQAVSYLNDNGKEAYIVYVANIWNHEQIIDHSINVIEKFKKYNLKIALDIQDDNCNILIVPEIFSKILYQYKRIQKAIWWLSWNFFEDRNYNIRATRYAQRKNIPGFLVKPAIFIYEGKYGKQFNFGKDRNSIRHFYNCEFIKKKLLLNKIDENRTKYLCGMIRDEYLNWNGNYSNKKNIILYNPAKDKELFAEKVFNQNKLYEKGYELIKIQNMSPSQISQLMQDSKLYVDFGYFPGPERMPREAVSMGCNIITSNIGAAENEIDVPIPSEYKFSPREENIKLIGNTIVELIENYSTHLPEFDKYRKKVMKQKNLFITTLINL